MSMPYFMGMALIYVYDSTKDVEDVFRSRLKDHELRFVDEPISLTNIDPNADVISLFVHSTADTSILSQFKNLKLIALRSTGFNNVSLRYCNDNNIAISNVPTYGERTVAEYAASLLLTLSKKIHTHLLSKGSDLEPEEVRGFDIYGKTIGVIGTGKIGSNFARIMHGFGAKVLAYDPYPKMSMAGTVEYCSLDNLLEKSDVISLHVPYNSKTHHLINEENIKTLKKGALVINTARGELIDNRSLIEALKDQRIAGAALDVVEGEGLLSLSNELDSIASHNPDNGRGLELLALSKLDNVIITPHYAYNTTEAVDRINQTSADNIIGFFSDAPLNLVEAQEELGRLILVRHTESTWNRDGKWTGQRDVHLSEKGFYEASLIGLKLKDIRIDKAFYSKQVRTFETLQAIINVKNDPHIQKESRAEINERDYGDYTGMNKWEMKERLGEELFNKVRRAWDQPVPNGESLKKVSERVVPFYEQEILPLLKQGKNILIVAHGNSIRALMKFIENISDHEVENLEMLFGSVVNYEIFENGKLKTKTVDQIDSTPPNA